MLNRSDKIAIALAMIWLAIGTPIAFALGQQSAINHVSEYRSTGK